MNDYDAIFESFHNEMIIPVEEKVCEHRFVNDDGYNFCICCGITTPIFVNPYIGFYERPTSVSAPYLKQNHFRNKLNEIQGVNAIHIPNYIMELCRNATNQEEVKRILQNNKQVKYYPLIYCILRQMDYTIPTFTLQEINQLVIWFDKIVKVYDSYKDPIQKNLINYHFILARLSTKLNRPDMLPFLFSLRSKRKRIQYHKLWIDIEKEL